MRWKDYIRYEKVLWCIGAIICIYMGLLLRLLSADVKMTAVSILGIVVIFVGISIGRFLFYRKRFKQLASMLEQTKDKYLCGEMLKKPTNFLEEKYFEVMREISHAAITKVEESQRLEREYEEYIEGWVHEIKTPLMAATLIAENEGNSQKLKRELIKADMLAENILYFAKLGSLGKDIQLKTCNMEDIVGAVLMEEMDILILSGISADVDVDGEVVTDPVLFKFVLKQLMVNAAKYCPGCTLHIEWKDEQLSVEDNGPGIAAHELPKVTEKGYIGELGRKNANGTGMGLYIAKTICGHLNIDFQIVSIEGRFTRFMFTFSKSNLSKM